MNYLNLKNGIIGGVLVLSMINVGCNKEEPTPVVPIEEEDNTVNACNGGDGFCMTYKGAVKSGDAKMTVINGSKIRVFWEQGASSTFEQVELDVYGLEPGTFDVNDGGSAGSAFVQYYSPANGGTNNAAYGTVTVSALDTNGVATGTFNVTMKDSTKITDGKFTNISK